MTATRGRKRLDARYGYHDATISSYKLISKLEISTVIYPGHGSSSTIGDELKNNEVFIQALTPVKLR